MTGHPVPRCQAERMTACAHMAGVVAHELNNALAVISSYAELAAASLAGVAASDPAALERAIDDLEQIALAGATTTQLTARLTTFARGRSGEQGRVHLGEVVRDLADAVPAAYSVELRAEPGLPPVIANQEDLEGLVEELLRNATEAMPDGGRLHLTATSRPPNVELRVQDDGPGVEPDVLDRAFDPFFTTKGHGVDRGLGLALVYGVVERAGGSVRLDSEVGAGTTATVLLPAAS